MNILKCNECGVSNCPKWTSKKIKDQWINLPVKPFDDATKCSSFIEYDTFKLPMLLQLSMPQKMAGLNAILTKYNIRLHEINRYPYFRLITK